MSEVDTKQTDGGRWDRTPYRPEDLKEQYGTNDSGKRLAVVCPGCGNDWYPLPTCCVREGDRASSPFCQYCGVDFRADPKDVNELRRFNVAARDDGSDEAIRKLIERCDGLSLDGESAFFREEKPRNDRSVDRGDERNVE